MILLKFNQLMNRFNVDNTLFKLSHLKYKKK